MNTRSSIDTEALDFSQGDMVRGLIEQRLIIGYGTVCDVPADGVVTVLLSVVKNEASATIVTCPYASSLVASSLALDIKPKVKDKVILLSPQLFDSGMFTREQTEPIVKEMAFGYSSLACVAVPMTQFREDEYHNVITLDDGKADAKLAWSEDDGVNHLLFSTNENGEISLKASYDSDNDGYKASLDISKDGKAEYRNPKATLVVGEDGGFSYSNEKASVTIDASGNVTVETEGKYTFKNKSGKSLYTVLKGMLGILNKTMTTYGSPGSHTVTPSQFQQQESDLDALME